MNVGTPLNAVAGNESADTGNQHEPAESRPPQGQGLVELGDVERCVGLQIVILFAPQHVDRGNQCGGARELGEQPDAGLLRGLHAAPLPVELMARSRASSNRSRLTSLSGTNGTQRRNVRKSSAKRPMLPTRRLQSTQAGPYACQLD